MDPNVDFAAHPEYLEGDFWRDSPYTFFVYCPFDVTLGGLHRGEGMMSFPDFYPGEHSPDGYLWSFYSREGNHLYDANDLAKSKYFKGFIDRSQNSTEWGPVNISEDNQSGLDYSCETGILPGSEL